AKEVGPFGITANAIAPGFVATELIGQFTDDMRERLHRQNPVGRMCRPEEVAALVAFLCSTHAAFINGECVCIDGGRRDFYWGWGRGPGMSDAYLMGIDIGAGSLKTMVVAADGAVRGSASAELRTSSPRAGWSEQDPADWWRALCATVPRALA